MSHFVTTKVKNFMSMFSNCYAVEVLDVDSFNTDRANMIAGMFFRCKSLKSVDLRSFNTKRAQTFAAMFAWCSSLTSIDISNFDISGIAPVQGYTQMFLGCTALKEMNVGKITFAGSTAEEAVLSNVGTADAPCKLIVSSDFDTSVLGAKQGNYYLWLGGYFDEPTVVSTGIGKIASDEAASNANAPVYNLGGQRVNRDYRGVVVINGKKYLNK